MFRFHSTTSDGRIPVLQPRGTAPGQGTAAYSELTRRPFYYQFRKGPDRQIGSARGVTKL